MQAIILAGGFGTRLKEVCSEIPKSMVNINGRPFLELLVLSLKKRGVENFIFCTGHLSSKIKGHFKDGHKFKVNIIYSEEDKPLLSAGAIKKAEKLLEDDFLVINGDVYFDIDYKSLFEFHKKNKALITVAGQKLKKSLEGMCHTFYEKNSIISRYFPEYSALANGAVTGIFVINKYILRQITKNKPLSLERELIPNNIKTNRIFAKYYSGYFIDVGTPDNYRKFIKDAQVLNLT